MRSPRPHSPSAIVVFAAVAIAAVACTINWTSPNPHEIVLFSTHARKASVGEEDLANSILRSAKTKFVHGGDKPASKAQHAVKATTVDGFVLDSRAAAVLHSSSHSHQLHAGLKFASGGSAPTSSLLKRMPTYVAKGAQAIQKRKESARQKLEQKIASHKLTTRGLVLAVQQAEQKQTKELNQALKDQTDDLIIAKVPSLTKLSPHKLPSPHTLLVTLRQSCACARKRVRACMRVCVRLLVSLRACGFSVSSCPPCPTICRTCIAANTHISRAYRFSTIAPHALMLPFLPARHTLYVLPAPSPFPSRPPIRPPQSL